MSTAVVVMAYGSPRSLDELPAYLADIRGGREPSPEAVADLRARYERIGGSSPLERITTAQATALSAELGLPVVVGMKHAAPTILDAVRRAATCGARRLAGIVLAPHYSAMSVGAYERKLLAARDEVLPGAEVAIVESWYAEPAFVGMTAAEVRRTAEGAHVIFTAHSLPASIVDAGDPYADQLHDSARLVAEAAGVASWEVAWQSASPTGVPWLGPDVCERIDELGAEGVRDVAVAPIGFVSEHLEILYDLDVQATERASAAGVRLRVVRPPNDDPALIAALASAVRRTLG